MKQKQAEVSYGKVLSYGSEEFQLYLDELAEECGNFLRLIAKLRQLPARPSEGREDLETDLYSSLSHIEAHARQLREWWDQLDESLPDED
jgi:hypothetical protein